MRVTLSWDELSMGSALGCRIVIQAMEMNRPKKYGQSGFGWNNNIEGYCAEIAVAKALGLNYAPKRQEAGAPDLGTDIQVRWVTDPSYRLIVRETDNPGHRYILVTGEAPTYTLEGWILGEDARQLSYLSDPRNGRPPAWFVPKTSLRPMESWAK